jgi:hypothetical protein
LFARELVEQQVLSIRREGLGKMGDPSRRVREPFDGSRAVGTLLVDRLLPVPVGTERQILPVG